MLAGLTGNDLALASLLPKPSSGDGNSNSILLLSSAMKQPIYVFENGKLLQSYGKGLGGTPITIGYDSKNQQYFGFTNKGTGNSGSIFEAISGSTQGKYSADILKGIACPIVPKEPLNPPSPSTPQPKPLSPAELSGAKFLLDSLTVDKQGTQAKEAKYYQNILQIAGQNMCDAEAKKRALDETLTQQAYAAGGSMGLDIPKIIKPMEGCKTTGDTDKNISDYFNNPNSKYANNQLVKSVAQAGEVIEWAGSNVAHGVSQVEGGQETLAALGVVVGGVVDGVKYVAKNVTKVVLPSDVYESAAESYSELPRGVQIATEFVGDCVILGGVSKVANLAGTKVLNSFKGAATEGTILGTGAVSGEISAGLGESSAKLLSAETSLLKATGGNVVKPSSVSVISGSGAGKISTNIGNNAFNATANTVSKITSASTEGNILLKNTGGTVAAETAIGRLETAVKYDAAPTAIWSSRLTTAGGTPYTGVSAESGKFWKTPAAIDLDIRTPSISTPTVVSSSAVTKPLEAAGVSLVVEASETPAKMLVVGENIKPIIQLEAPPSILPYKLSKDEIKSFAKKHDWSNLPEIVKSLPEGYNFANYAKGDKTIGIEFAKGTHNKIALKKAKLDADYPSQQVDYVSYRVNGNMHVARNGDLIYESKGNIMRRDYITDQVSVIPVEELQRLGITNPKNFLEVHIPMDEFFKNIDEFIKKWNSKK